MKPANKTTSSVDTMRRTSYTAATRPDGATRSKAAPSPTGSSAKTATTPSTASAATTSYAAANATNLVSGGPGNDTLDGGPGSDEINARDGEKDTIVIRFGEGDVVYYDKGLDVLKVPVEGRGIADKVELTTERPPEGLFEPSGKILVGTRARSCSWPSRHSKDTSATATRSSTRPGVPARRKGAKQGTTQSEDRPHGGPGHGSPGPSPCPYSPECVEGQFCELRL
jgi:hypothetical protein